ncbi:TIGR03619 family F420-dependent LLM class oxidoreductase [Kibdelosporangium philippinense]|uniref:TIGR03619 family F420-dependent LLM class oxidoreductase n=1 Tax=Kibdelosporangium philippinense TaxID=211113 RepID=A0ABS8ZNK4_9PSEU|nr:TIGR03619 family F420-dependent LLM class oxidoreductase [Kibdelosporangium philippinense]MCE7009137.1 TIGR03619 family F420-dependent LLM class oxidoreductase [Kibdelosporangium philippinense]
MKIGFGAPVAGAWATAANVARFAESAEKLGYSSLWTFHRLLVPAEHGLDAVYRSVLDPTVAMSFMAARTSTIRLGVALINFPFASPAYVAKQFSTLDLLSGGRVDLGLGAGWLPDEFVASGASMERRGARTVEYVQVLRTLFADEVSSFDGEFYTVPPSRMDPKPVQKPGPPVLLGGAVPAALKRAGRIADGWMSRSATNLDEIAAQIAIVRAGAAEAGKDPAGVRVVVRGVVRPGERVGRLSGSYSQIRADAEWLGEQGVTELFYDLNWDPRIGNPDASVHTATETAHDLLEALKPS